MVANGTATCAPTGCGFTCNAGYSPSGSTCVAVPMNCGNRALDAMETCDDGNRTDGDGCSASCQMEAGVVGETCGGGTVIRITGGAGHYWYTGTTAGRMNNVVGVMGCCGAGPDVNLRIQLGASGSGTVRYSIMVEPTGDWDVVLRGGMSCPTSYCTDVYLPGNAEDYTWSYAGGTVLEQLIDGCRMGDSGAFTMRLTIL
jgi:cysteine-rich repeat protein